jgi:PAS domain S-box-containing protein
MTGSSVIGALGISTVTKEITWPEEDINILKIYGQIIAGALARRAADRAIHESEELYRTVFESTGTAMMILEEDKTVAMVNREFERISGYSREEVCGIMPWTRFVSPEDVRRMQEYHILRRNSPEKVPVNYEFMFLSRNGQKISTYITVEMIPETKRSVVSLIDVSKEKAAQQEVVESEEKFRSLAESLAEGIYMIQDDRFIYVNPASARMFGYTVEELLAIPDFTGIFAQEDRQRVRDSVAERLSGLKETARYTARGLRSDGTTISVVIHGSKTNYRGKPAIIGTVTQDVDTCPPPLT